LSGQLISTRLHLSESPFDRGLFPRRAMSSAMTTCGAGCDRIKYSGEYSQRTSMPVTTLWIEQLIGLALSAR